MVNPWPDELNFFWENKAFSIIPKLFIWHKWFNSFLMQDKDLLISNSKVMAADELTTEGTRASEATVLI